VGQVQVADEGTHKPRLAHAGCQGKAEGGELPLEIRYRRKFAPDGRKLVVSSRCFSGRAIP
jgi:hypothetical protein